MQLQYKMFPSFVWQPDTHFKAKQSARVIMPHEPSTFITASDKDTCGLKPREIKTRMHTMLSQV